MRKINWGMIGCGDVTEVKNGPGLYLNENCALDAICNRTYEKALDWAKRHNQPTVCRTADMRPGPKSMRSATARCWYPIPYATTAFVLMAPKM